MKYHLNPETGTPSRCSAKLKCPFGDLETEHYSSVAEAQAAYESLMDHEILPRFKSSNKSDDTNEVAPPRSVTGNETIDRFIDRRQMGASVRTVIDESPEFEAIDLEDAIEWLEVAITHLARNS